MMTFLFVNNYFNLFAKADSGASQRSMSIIRALAKIGHVDVVSFVDDTLSNEPNVDVIYSQHIDMANNKKGRINQFLNLFCTRKPYAIFPENKQKSLIIEKIVERNKYDFIVVRYFYYACDCGLIKYSKQLLLDIDDDPKEVVLMSLDKINTWFRRLYYRSHAHTVQRVTKYAMKKVFKASYSSPGMSYPNSLFLPNIPVINKPVVGGDFSHMSNKILIVGWFRYYPNNEGLSHFITHIFPLIREHVRDAELDVVGKMDDVNLKSLCHTTEGVNQRGFVEDLKESYSSCKCVVVPIYKGTGTSVKLVEAFACGKAVVTTSVGKRGLHPSFQEGTDYLLADTDEEFANNVVKLLIDAELNEKTSKRAQKKVQTYYSEKAFNEIIHHMVFNN